MTRWTNQPRRNVHVEDEPTIARLVLGLIAGLWICAAVYGVVVGLLAL